MLKSDMDNEISRRSAGRRTFLLASGAAVVGLAWWHYQRPEPAHGAPAPAGEPKQVTIIEFTDAGERKGTISVPTIQKTDAEWRKQLSSDSFEVTRHAGTERAFTGELLNVHDKGVFRCICCDTAAFQLGGEIRIRHWLAQFLGPHCQGKHRRIVRQQLRYGAHGRFLSQV